MKSLNETTAVIYAPEILSNFPTKKTNANGTGYTTVYAPVESDRFLNDTTAVTYAYLKNSPIFPPRKLFEI